MTVRPLAIDFAHPPRSGRVLGTLLAGLGAVALLWVLAQLADAREERDRQATRLEDTARLARRAMPSLAVETKVAPGPDSHARAAEVNAAHAVIVQLAPP